MPLSSCRERNNMKDQAMKCATLLAIVCAQWLPCYGEQKAGETFRSPAGSETNKGNAGRSAYFGDLHLHTSYSFDAYFTPGVTVDPDMAYRFAKGEVVNYLGQPVQRREPLDFIAITDHAENIGVFNQLEVPDSDFAKSDLGKAFKNLRSLITSDPRWRQNPAFLEQLYSFGRDYFSGSTNKLPQDLVPERTAAWDREIAFANRHYQPGKFTTFIAYEWSSTPFGANLHRNVIFRGDKAPFPFSSFDSKVPEDLWKWLDTIRAQGYEAIAIPHNSNASNGLMYDWVDSYSLPIGREYAQDRQRNEPLSEIAQSKGASETHPLLSPNDEFADYELYDFIAGPRRMAGRAEGSYLRDAVGKGVVLQRQLGVNPYKYGFVGGSDFHSGLSVSAQSDYAGRGDTINMGAGRPTKDQVANALDPSRGSTGIGLRTTSGNLTGVWADSNTRESIYDALRRRETFATSGTRLKFRIFGGWDFGDSKLLFQNDWVRSAYARGVPMGSDLPERPIGASAPQFTIWALKDP